MASDFQGSGFSVLGELEFNKRILNLIRALPDELERAAIAEFSEVLELAKDRTPVEFGNLKDSGVIVGLKTQGSNDVGAQISFGGTEPSSEYAIFVHEDLNANHPRGGQAKFLESAVLDKMDGMASRVANRIKLERLLS